MSSRNRSSNSRAITRSSSQVDPIPSVIPVDMENASKQESIADIVACLKSMNVKLEKLDSIDRTMVEIKRELDDQKHLVSDLTTRIETLESDVTTKQNKISNLEQSLKANANEILSLGKTVASFESRMNEQEQYSRRDNLVISGLKFNKPFNRAVNDDADAADDAFQPDRDPINGAVQVKQDWSTGDRNIMAQNFIQTINQRMETAYSVQDILDIHSMRPKSTNSANDGTNIVVRFNNRRTRDEIYFKRKFLKGSKIFINEHLTASNSKLFKAARDARSQHRIDNTWTKNCKIFIKKHNGTVSWLQHVSQLPDNGDD